MLLLIHNNPSCLGRFSTNLHVFVNPSVDIITLTLCGGPFEHIVHKVGLEPRCQLKSLFATSCWLIQLCSVFSQSKNIHCSLENSVIMSTKRQLFGKLSSFVSPNLSLYSGIFAVPLLNKAIVFALELTLKFQWSYSPWLLRISLQNSHENLVLNQDNNFYLIRLSILITCLLNNVLML